MNANWTGFLAAIAAVSAFYFVYRFLKGRSGKERVGWVILSGVTALPAASFSIYYLHWFPETWWYFEFRSWRGIEWCVVALGVVGGAVGTFFPGVLRSIPLAATIAFSVVPFLKPVMGPLPYDLLTDLWRDEVCMQSLPSTCGAASSATVLRQLGILASEEEVVRAAYSYVNGTEAWYLARFLRKKGCEVRFRTGVAPEDLSLLPAIVGVDIVGLGHFVPFLEQTGPERFVIGDPLRGREELSLAVLERRYRFTGWCMEISRPTQTQPASQSPDGG